MELINNMSTKDIGAEINLHMSDAEDCIESLDDSPVGGQLSVLLAIAHALVALVYQNEYKERVG